MSQSSAIEWTDATWNPVRGCIKVSPGCAHCYAETFAERFRGVKGHPYEQGFDLRLVPAKLEEPFTWKQPRRVFVNSMSDLFQDDVPDTFIMNVFTIMEQCPQHTFQVLTKRAERMRQVVSWLARKWADCGDRFPLPNVWLGVSVENQHFADERIPVLLQTSAAVRFISAEPLLGPLNITSPLVCRCQGDDPYIHRHYPEAPHSCARCGHRRCAALTRLDWVIVGGESGHGARPFDVAWARSIVGQCRAAGVPCFVKQLGSDARDAAAARDDMGARDVWPAGWTPTVNGRCVWQPDLTDRKGGDPSEWPEDLRVREFPVRPDFG